MKKRVKYAVRLTALLLLMALGLCGCNSNSVTEAPTQSESATASETAKPTKKPTSKPKPTQTQATLGQAGEGAAKKRVAITFDDGPDDKNTKMLVDALKGYGFNATFFVVGQKLDGTRMDGSDILKYVLDNGNEVGVHAYTNSTPYDGTCTDERFESEMTKTAEAIHAIVPDYEIKLMRPVQGKITDARVAASPYSVIHWSIDTLDWKYTDRSTELKKSENILTIVNSVLSRVKDGDIVLMHDVHDNSYEAALIILEELYYAGYEVVTVSELLGEGRETGRRYYSAK